MRTLSELTATVWFPLALLPLFLLLHYSHIAQPIESLVLRAMAPVAATITQREGLRALPIVFSFSMLPKEQKSPNTPQSVREQELEDQIQNLIVENAHLQSLVEEAKLLEEERKFLEERSLRAIPARVTTRTSEGLTQAVIVNRGTRDGLIVGLPVVTGNGVLIGTITHCNDATAVVLLVTSHSSRINAAIQNTAHSPGIVQGAFNISLQMQYIPQSDTVNASDVVATSGNDPHIPEGLTIGTIEETQSEPGALFQQASVQPLFETTALSTVSILLP